MLQVTTSYDDRALRVALRRYLDLRPNVKPEQELKRRAKNIGMRLIRMYKQHAASRQDIRAKVKALGFQVKIRESIRDKGGDFKGMVRAEIRARQNATQFTSTGWFPAVIQLGGNPRKKRNLRGPMRGKLVEKKTGPKMHKTLINSQPGADRVSRKAGNAIQKAVDAERDDMIKYINRKLAEAAQSSGL